MRINLTKKDLVNSIYMQIGYSKKVSETLLEEFFVILLNNVIQKKILKISKFGTFFLKEKKQIIGRNPKTKKEAIISARNVISFKPSKEFKKFVNDI